MSDDYSVTVECPACGELVRMPSFIQVEDPWYHTDGPYRYLRCPTEGCATLVQHPPPDSDSLENAYEAYFTHGNSQNGLRALIASKAGGGHRLRVLDLPSPGHGPLLDIGCGDASDMIRLHQRGWDVAGVDNDPAARKVARERNMRVYETLEDLPENFRPSVVVMRHFVEHIADPVTFLQELRPYLGASPTVVMVTPNAASWGRRLFGKWWRGYDAPRHLQIFTPNALFLATQRAGYHVQSLRTGSSSFGGVPSSSFILWTRRAGLPPAISYLVGRTLGIVVEAILGMIGIMFRQARGEEIILHATPEQSAEPAE